MQNDLNQLEATQLLMGRKYAFDTPVIADGVPVSGGGTFPGLLFSEGEFRGLSHGQKGIPDGALLFVGTVEGHPDDETYYFGVDENGTTLISPA